MKESQQKIWTNILALNNKVIDYNIGTVKKDKLDWIVPFHFTNRITELEVISSYELVNTDEELEQAFKNGMEKVKVHIKQYDCYFDHIKDNL